MLVLLVAVSACVPALRKGSTPGTTPESAGALVDRIVALVENTPITAAQVALETAILHRVAASDRRGEFGRLLTEPVDPLESLMFRAILQSLPDLRGVRVDDDSAAYSRLRAFEETFTDRAAAARFRDEWGLSRSALLQYFKDSVVLDRFIELSVDVKVGEEEQRAYYDRNKDLVFAGSPYEEVSAEVTRRVYNVHFEANYNSWRSRLRAAAQKRYIGR